MKIFSCHMPHAQSRQTLRAWGFFELFPKWKQLLDKKKSSRIKYGYHHVMDLKSKPKLYGAKLLIAVL
ncbi:phage protein [Streptococcus pneumoniae]|uniref:Phage protein n=2 Tax=Streptococcus pneumoniae TaxID=1313 RepID=A0A4M3TSH6_STREE|nr:hypothetical protein [Streptococcus pneumoniae]EJG59325.1 hypothetical protein AMCSP07_002208 [Streptococcus pneumoniae 2071004]MDS3593276.1 hypothetical protein [Streptococcus pneumoniae]MDS3650539.1 hypothetical protein [Streptococcus pneumoniae]MDS4896776.1 hypothetical protein [Streptococcus pneumoniae]MDS5951430.1 hypothetical protein [Streptococcus pneumoniae]